MSDVAPPVDSPRPQRTVIFPVLGAGITTTAFTLLGVWAINQVTDEFNIMGWYAALIFPVGAIIVGLAAGSGYGLCAWWLNRRVSRPLYWVVGVLQVSAYFAAQYQEYRHLQPVYDDGTPVSFVTYFDVTTRSFTYKSRHSGDRPSQPLGAWGYGIRLLEIAGFTLGGLCVPFFLSKKPYCTACSSYMRTKVLGWLPAGVAPRKVKKSDADGMAQYEKDQTQAFDRATGIVAQLGALSGEGRRADIESTMAEHGPRAREYQKLVCRFQISLSTCPHCGGGHLNAIAFTGSGDKVKQTPVATYPFTPGTRPPGPAQPQTFA